MTATAIGPDRQFIVTRRYIRSQGRSGSGWCSLEMTPMTRSGGLPPSITALRKVHSTTLSASRQRTVATPGHVQETSQIFDLFPYQIGTPPAETGGLISEEEQLLLLAALLAGLAGLLPWLLLLLIRLLLSTAWLSALTWLLARLLGLLSALILISHNYLQLECELSRDGQLPARVLCSFQRNIHNQRSFGSDDRKSVECRLI